jgi:predicted Zn-dependent peptidase
MTTHLDRSIAPSLGVIDSSFSLPAVDKHNISEGLTYHILQDDTINAVRLEIYFHGGKRAEKKSGAALLTSILLLEGTKELSSTELAERISFFGSKIRVSSGYDHFKITLISLPRYFPETLDILCAVLENVSFSQDSFFNIKSRIKNSLAVNKQKTSYQASTTFREMLFGSSHPYGLSLTEEQLEELTLSDIKEYYSSILKQQKSIYVCGNTGNFSPTDTPLNNTLKDFNGSSVECALPKAIGEKAKHVELEHAVQSSIRLGKHFIDRTHDHFIPCLLANEILGGYFGSRLMKNIREEKGYTYGIHSSISYLEQSTSLIIAADVKKEFLEQTFEEIDRELLQLSNQGPSPEELHTAIKHFIGVFSISIETVLDYFDRYKVVQLYDLPETFYHDLLEKLPFYTAEDLRSMYAMYFNPKDLIRVSVG